MSIATRLLQLLYPDDVACWACGREAVLDASGLCTECRETLVRTPSALACPPELDGLCAGLVYTGAAASAVRRFKYERQVWLAPHLAAYMEIPPEWEADCLVPVPLHPFREWQRTYNQSELICRALSKRFSLPIRKALLRRVRYTRQQARLSAAVRKRNTQGAFMANTRAAGLAVVLVDDVTTTHSTLIACATALRHAGASRVYAACACVAGYDGES